MKLISSLTFVLFIVSGYSQHTNFNTQRNWSLNKREVVFGFGATQFTGDLGGRDQIGKDYSLVDIDLPATHMNGMVGFRYRFHPFWATSTNLHVGMIRGNDALTNEVIRNNRNLHFRSLLIEIQQRIECIVFSYEKFGSRFGLPGGKGFRDHNEQLYLFTGVGGAYFNPKAQYNGEWIALRPLGTEGQGLDPHMVYPINGETPFMYTPPNKYLPVTLTIPFGVGFRLGIGKMWRVGLEFTYVKTFTDYMDDVSGYYYDPSKLSSPTAAYLSNPALNNTTWFAPGQVRGNDEKDAYYYSNFVIQKNVTYKDLSRKRKRYQSNKARYKF